MMKTLRIIAPFHNIGGYSHAARGLLAAALRAGYVVEAVESEINAVTDFRIDGAPANRHVPRFPNKPIPDFQREELNQALRTTVSPDAPTILMGNPGIMTEWEQYAHGPRIGYTMLESDTLQPQWAQACRNVDLLLSPSMWCLETFRLDVKGVASDLLPICIDERLWSPEGPKRMISPGQPPFLFLSIFSTCERKGWRKTIQAFAEEFRGDNVGLVLKPTRITEVEELAEWVRSMGAAIEVIKGDLTDYEMACLYRACDVYVSPSAEGFGNPLVEAAMCGLPSVALNEGGTRDIVSLSNGYPVPAEWEPCVGQLPQIYPSSHRWPTCSVADLRKQMRTAYEDESRAQRSIVAEAEALRKFSRTQVGHKLLHILEGITHERIEIAPRSDASPFVAVITTHNQRSSTNRLVQSLIETAGSLCYILIADDNSTDDTRDWAEGSGFAFIACKTGGNVSQNRQIAIDYIHKHDSEFPADPFVVFFDNDIEVAGNWWETLHGIMQARPEIGILAPKKMYGPRLPPAPLPLHLQDDHGDVQNIGNRLYFNGGSFPVFLERDLIYPDYVESACMVVRPEVWRLCAWDPQFPIFYEDTDFCFQCRELGFDACATSLATVIHHAHTTSHSRASETEVNRMRFLKKWKDLL